MNLFFVENQIPEVSYSIYDLEACHSLNAHTSKMRRQGALLKAVFASGKTGYADIHSWPELGDLPFSDLLKGDLSTPLVHFALKFAHLDAEARYNKESILDQLNIPHSHFLIHDILLYHFEDIEKIIHLGFENVKIKCGRHLENEAKQLLKLFSQNSLKIRLDFNETLTPVEFISFLTLIQPLQEKIEFIEDPFPFHYQKWAKIQEMGWALACDRQAGLACNQADAARYLIIKPAIQGYQAWMGDLSQIPIVTTYLGHPIGQMAAAYAASIIDPHSKNIHGLLSHHSYMPNLFSKQLNWKSPQFTVPKGIGFGFGQELEALHWRTIINPGAAVSAE